MSRRHLSHLVALLGLFTAGGARAEELPAFKIRIEEDGVYRLTAEELYAAGLERKPLVSAALGLSVGGRPVPIWVEDGGDGRFNGGDAIEFVGEHLRGASSYYNDTSRFNVYRLETNAATPVRMRAPAIEVGAVAPSVPLQAREHLEQDRLMLRFSQNKAELETWYWHRLTPIDREPFALALDLSEAQPAPMSSAHGGVKVRVSLQGWSFTRIFGSTLEGPPDHRVDAMWNGVFVGAVEWNGQESAELVLDPVPVDALKEGLNELRLSVPARAGADGASMVDVVVLNWIEVSYPRRPELARDQTRFIARGGQAGGRVTVEAPPNDEIVFYGMDGTREVGRSKAGATARQLPVAAGDTELYAVRGGRALRAVEVVSDRPSRLAATDHQADYLMIAHGRLLEAARPLADYHRSRGLTVELIDVEDVYDEFSHGVVSAAAIRDFIAHAYHRWRTPAPRFVLLVGDASWDVHNEEMDDTNYVDWTFRPGDGLKFRKNRSTNYAKGERPDRRALIPTWSYRTSQGHAASDNEFVAVDGDDVYPDLAIGRFPVVEPEEVSGIVAKSIRYGSQPEVGPWRSRMLLIAGEGEDLEQTSEEVASMTAAMGFEPRKMYSGAEPPTAERRGELRSAFDEGFAVVHFTGHGGRYIWRTAPADPKRNFDLFGLPDLDQLAPNAKLPIVLSMTCYSAPFDHPTADSIGEKFLRMPDRGAVAVIAASWRNAPLTVFSKAMVREIAKGGTIGEAFQRGKRAAPTKTLIALYNLLGDPALPISRPALAVDVKVSAGAAAIEAVIDGGGFEGRAIVEWLDAEQRPLGSSEVAVSSSRLHAEAPPEMAAGDAVRWIRVYAWSEAKQLDALGALELAPAAEPTTPSSATEPGRPATVHGSTSGGESWR